jgi:uncharacterized membrane protein
MRFSTLLAIHAWLFLAIFFCLGFSALALGDNGFLALAYIVLGIASLFGCLSFITNAKGL